MGIIKALKLGFDYQRYDDDGNVVDMQRAVNDVNLDIEAGEFVAVLGHNGSGKSTLAKHMNALLIPTEGTMPVSYTHLDVYKRQVADQIAKTKKKLNEILSMNTGQPLEIVERDTDRDNYMTAEEAKAYGLIDGVVIHK